MIDFNLLKNQGDLIAKKIHSRGENINISSLVTLNEQKNKLQAELDVLKNEKNQLSDTIGKLAKTGRDISDKKNLSLELNQKIETLLKSYEQISGEFKQKLLEIPNIPDNDVPEGSSEQDNIELNRKIFNQDQGLDHIEIGNRLGCLDIETASKLSGSRFMILKGRLAQLHRALINFMLDEAKDNGYEENYVPYIVNRDALINTGQLPKFEDDQFKLTNEKFLIPTAEVPLTNFFSNSTINSKQLPINVCAHTPCFRAEAGSYCKDTKGIIRQHQFDKIELVKLVDPNESDQELTKLVSNATQILDKLELSYRTILLSTGDLGFSAAKTIDIEVWLPSQNCFREISSCSNFRDFQARRMKAHVKSNTVKYFPHTLNGSALAVGRCLVAIMENNYSVDKGLLIPKCLHSYLPFKFIDNQG